MINTIKGLMDSEKRISEVVELSKKSSDLAAENRKALLSMSKEMQAMREGFSDLDKAGREMLQSIGAEAASMKGLRETLKAEVMDFKLLKTTLQQKLVEEIETEFRKELSIHCDRLKTDVKSYNDLKQQLQDMTSLLEQTKSELAKFNGISRGIKEADFQLGGYIKKITALDQEKLRLMKRVDELERLIGQERRRRQEPGTQKVHHAPY